MEKIKINDIDVILDDTEDGKGKVIISSYNYNFSYYWNAMGKNTDLKKFITEINADYFANALAGGYDGVFDAKGTFRNVRKHIREELSYELAWYKHMEFQKEMKSELNNWQSRCCSEYRFVEEWPNFWRNTIDYYLINDSFDRKDIESLLCGICEHWYFIEKDRSREYYFCLKLHKDLVKFIKKATKQ
jgi:hypothetical protein